MTWLRSAIQERKILRLLPMSEEQLSAFLIKLKEDKGLRDKLKVADNLDDALAIANDAGFTVFENDLNNIVGQANELSDAELEGVTGGSMCTNSTNGCEGTLIIFSLLTVFDSGC